MSEAPGPVRSDPHPHSHREAPELPARVTLPLLTLITQQSLDEDYEVVAQTPSEPLATSQGDVAGGDDGAPR